MQKSELEHFKDEVVRHFGVIAEDIKSDLRGVAEGVTTNTKKIDILTEQVGVNTQRIIVLQDSVENINETLDVMKLDLEFIKNELKQKINRDEFTVLEKRLSLLETKVAHIN